MNIEADNKFEKPHYGDIIVFVHQNKHEGSYLIAHNRDNKVTLTNLASGQTNYVGDSINSVIDVYLQKQKSDSERQKYTSNPILYYYFIKNYHTTIKASKTFGFTEINKETE